MNNMNAVNNCNHVTWMTRIVKRPKCHMRKMNLIVALTELKEDEDGEFPWTSNNVSSAVFRAHPICGNDEVKSGGGKIG